MSKEFDKIKNTLEKKNLSKENLEKELDESSFELTLNEKFELRWIGSEKK